MKKCALCLVGSVIKYGKIKTIQGRKFFFCADCLPLYEDYFHKGPHDKCGRL